MRVNRNCRIWLLAATVAVLSTAWTPQAFAQSRGAAVVLPASAPRLEVVARYERIVLEWSRVADAREYHVFRSTNGTFSSTPFARVDGRAFRDYRVANGTSYSYRVAAANRAGTGPVSNVASAMPLAPPAGLTGTPGDTKATLAWRASAGATEYIVYRGRSWSPEGLAEIGRGPALEFVDTGLTNGKIYFYRVRARNATNQSRLSEPVQVKPKAPPVPAPTVAPTGLTGTLASGKITLTWSAVAGATGYKVYRTTTDVFPTTPLASPTTPTFVDTAVVAGTTYRYKVAASNAGGTGPLSGAVVVAPTPAPTVAPTGLTGTLADGKITLTWSAVAGATGYRVFRTTTDVFPTTPLASPTTPTFLDTTVVAGTTYRYKVAAANAGGTGPMSDAVIVAPTPAPASAPANLVATFAAGKITLTWTAVPGVTGYRVFKSLNDTFGTTPLGSTAAVTYTDPNAVTLGTTYFYRVAAYNATGNGPMSTSVNITPATAPSAPAGLSIVAGNAMVTLAWAPTTGATSYNVYRGTATNAQSATAVATALATTAFVDAPLANGTPYFYKVTAVGAGGESARSAEITATPIAPPPVADPTVTEAFQLLRQATWGPRPGDVDAVRTMGRDAFLNQQFAAAPSQYPDALLTQSLEVAQEHFMSLALNGQDQLRQRVAWALHKIWVVSGVEVQDTGAIVTYHRLFLNGAFGNYRDLMEQVTLNPAMGRYLNMLNSRRQTLASDPLPNENYPRELLQLFTLGLVRLNPNGTTMVDSLGNPLPTYTEADVKALARILTGWVSGDGNPATTPTSAPSTPNWLFPMEPLASRHDTADKGFFLGTAFPAGATAQAEMDNALDVIFNHPNLAPFVARQLIQQLVTSNPSASYVAAIAAVFENNGGGVRGDLGAVVRAILTHPSATSTTNMSGKLSEPVLFIASTMRAFSATVTTHPFMTDRAEAMGQRVFFPPSVFSYFSPGFRVRGTDNGTGTPLQGPEFQGLTSVTGLERANFIGDLLANRFSSEVTSIDYTPFTSRAADAAALVDYCSQTFMGGRMSPEHRARIISAVNVTAATNPTERVRTAIYLTLTSAQAQVDR